MLILEEYVQERNDGMRYHAGESGMYEPYTENKGELFRAMQREHGRCTGHVYIDGEGMEPVKVGWVFQKRVKFSDCNETFLQETWVTLHKSKPTVKTTHHYQYI